MSDLGNLGQRLSRGCIGDDTPNASLSHNPTASW